MINPTPAKIIDILNSESQFEVPKYQRDYTWGKTQSTDFFDDLMNYSDGENNLFLGTLIFEVSEANKKKIRIVDGQQRITTIMILLIACRNVAKKINAVQMATRIQEKITFTDMSSGEYIGHRLLSSDSIRDLFDEISKFDWNGEFPIKIGSKQVKRQINRIKPIYDFFLEKIQDFDQPRLKKFLDAIYSAYVIRIDIQDEIEALSIFERTNNRGVDLEVSDLLKNHLFAQGVDGLEETWNRIIDNSDGSILRMLKYFYVSKKGYTNKTKLYNEIKKYGAEVGTKNLVEQLDEFSSFYYVIRSADSAGLKTYFESIDCDKISKYEDRYEAIHSSLVGLRLFKISQIYPLIFSAIDCFRKNNGEPKQLIRVFDTLEKYHFINNGVCDRVGNEVEKPYADFSEKYSSSDDFEKTSNDLIKMLSDKLASESEFVSRFVDISYSSESTAIISYIFDRINNFGLSPASRIKIYNPDQKILRRNHSIEHFYPQNPEDSSEEMEADSVHNIGNLLAVCFKTNSSLGNLTPEKKIAKLENELMRDVQNLSYVKDFIEEYKKSASSWNKNLISKRANKLAEEAYKEIWKIK